jgi:hypothetical protein
MRAKKVIINLFSFFKTKINPTLNGTYAISHNTWTIARAMTISMNNSHALFEMAEKLQ